MATYSAPGALDIDLAAPLSTDEDVIRRIDSLVDQESRQLRSLWLVFLSGDGVQLPVVVPIDDVPEWPVPDLVGNVCSVIAHVVHETTAGSALITLTRPGDDTVSDSDRYWLRTLAAAAGEHGAAIRMMCLATQGSVRRLTLDDAA
jgi:hypothetical protein